MASRIVDVKAKTIQNYYSANALSDKFFVFDSSSLDAEGNNHLIVTDFPVRVDVLMSIICVEGTLSINIGYNNYVIHKNDFINIFPNGVFHVMDVSDDFSAKIICIEPDFFDFNKERYNFELANMLREYPCQSLPPSKIKLVSFLLNYIEEIILEKDNVYRKEIVYHVLKIMSHEALSNLVLIKNENKKEKTSSPNEEIFRKFVKDIEINFQKERTVTFYAGKAFLTPKYFSAIIFRLTGKRAKDWIDEYTIMGAKAMLKSSYLTIQQISYELNFATPSHFGRYFKHHMGISPLQYRNS